MEIGISKDIYKRGLSSTVARGLNLCPKDLKSLCRGLNCSFVYAGPTISTPWGSLKGCMLENSSSGGNGAQYVHAMDGGVGEGGDEPPVA